MSNPLNQSRTPRCFRTTDDGAIRLKCDWRRTFEILSQLEGEFVLQTRHAFARLIGREAPPQLHPGFPPKREMLGESLLCEQEYWSAAYAYIGPCECCGAPGRIEIRAADGTDALQVHAPGGISLDQWSAVVAELADTFQDEPARIISPPGFFYELPGSAVHCGDANALPALLRACHQENLTLSWQLSLPSIAHRREFVPALRSYTNGVLTAGDGRFACQLILPTVTSLALQERENLVGLHVVGAGDAVLLSIAAAPDADSVEKWHTLLQQHFPKTQLTPQFFKRLH